MRELGKVLGKQQEAEEIIRSEKERIMPESETYSAQLQGKTCYVTAGA